VSPQGDEVTEQAAPPTEAGTSLVEYAYGVALVANPKTAARVRADVLNLVIAAEGQAEARSLVPAQKPDVKRLVDAVTDSRHWDRLPKPIRDAAQPFLPTWNDVRGILSDRAASPAPSASGDLRAALDQAEPGRWMLDGTPCWCFSIEPPHVGWVHAPMCQTKLREWLGAAIARTEPPGE
jgi:hypothetical protein